MDVTGPLTKKNIPKMGSQMVLDFVNVTAINLQSQEELNNLVKNVLEKLQIKPVQEQTAVYDEEKGLSKVVLLDNGHLVAHTNWDKKTISFDFYYSIFHTHDEKLAGLKSLEVFLCDTLGWQNARQIVVIPRGYTTKIFLNYTSLYSLILQQVDFVYREKSEFGDLRVYDSAEKGMLLIWDNNLIFSESLKTRYSQDLYQNVNTDGQSLQNCLILGGADLQIAQQLLNNQNVKKVSVVEEDELVFYCTKKYFKAAKECSQHPKLEKIIKNQTEFLQNSAQQGSQYDAIFIDYKSQWTNERVPSQYNSTEFYTNIKKALKPKGKFTQLIGRDEKVETYKQILAPVGFNTVQLVMSPTTSYGEELQLLIVSE